MLVAASVRSGDCGALGSPTGRLKAICCTFTSPTAMGQEITKFSKATEGVPLAGLTCSGVGLVARLESNKVVLAPRY